MSPYSANHKNFPADCCEELDSAMKEALQDSLPEHHPGHVPSSIRVEGSKVNHSGQEQNAVLDANDLNGGDAPTERDFR
jgi:hypothetical protein